MITVLKSELKNIIQLNMYSDLHIIKEKIHFFELKYKKSFNDFEKSINQNNEVFETWDDYIEWKAYNESLKDIKNKLKDLNSGNIKIVGE